MWKYPDKFDVIVIGAGHAGCEAAYASSKMGSKTLLLTIKERSILKNFTIHFMQNDRFYFI